MHAFIHVLNKEYLSPTLVFVPVLWKGHGAGPQAVKAQHPSVMGTSVEVGMRCHGAPRMGDWFSPMGLGKVGSKRHHLS